MLAANLTFPESIIIKVWTQLSCCKDIKHSCSNPKIDNKTKLSVAGSSYKNMHLANKNIFTQLNYLKNRVTLYYPRGKSCYSYLLFSTFSLEVSWVFLSRYWHYRSSIWCCLQFRFMVLFPLLLVNARNYVLGIICSRA